MSQNLKFKLMSAVQNWKARHFPSGDTVEDQAQWIKSWIVAVLALASSAGLYLAIPRSAAEAELDPVEMSLQQLIPPGHVIVPIEPVNAEALDSVLDSHGLVDLFSSGQKSQGQILLNRVVVVRAPKNPRQFAVVLNESRMSSAQLIALTEPLYAVVRSQKDQVPSQFPSQSNYESQSRSDSGAGSGAISGPAYDSSSAPQSASESTEPFKARSRMNSRHHQRSGRSPKASTRGSKIVVVSEQVEPITLDEEENL